MFRLQYVRSDEAVWGVPRPDSIGTKLRSPTLITKSAPPLWSGKRQRRSRLVSFTERMPYSSRIVLGIHVGRLWLSRDNKPSRTLKLPKPMGFECLVRIKAVWYVFPLIFRPVEMWKAPQAIPGLQKPEITCCAR